MLPMRIPGSLLKLPRPKQSNESSLEHMLKDTQGHKEIASDQTSYTWQLEVVNNPSALCTGETSKLGSTGYCSSLHYLPQCS